MDVKKNKKWLKDNQKTNEAWSKVMQDYKLKTCTELEKINKERVKCMIIEMAYKKHPMLRTKNIKGIFSKKENTYSDSEFEKTIRDIYSQIHCNKLKI